MASTDNVAQSGVEFITNDNPGGGGGGAQEEVAQSGVEIIYLSGGSSLGEHISQSGVEYLTTDNPGGTGPTVTDRIAQCGVEVIYCPPLMVQCFPLGFNTDSCCAADSGSF